jgi:hypothetical protein
MNTKISVDESDGPATLSIPIEWGEKVSFCADFIPAENRQWLGGVIQRQVNEIIMRQRHDAIEGHKRLYHQLMAPKTLRGYEDEVKK